MESIQNIDQRKIKSVLIGTEEYFTIYYVIENEAADVKTH